MQALNETPKKSVQRVSAGIVSSFLLYASNKTRNLTRTETPIFHQGEPAKDNGMRRERSRVLDVHGTSMTVMNYLHLKFLKWLKKETLFSPR